MTIVDVQSRPFEHIGLMYRSARTYAEGCASFVRQALDLGSPALVAVPGDNAAVIKAALGREVDRVSFADMKVAGRNPGRIIPGVLLAFAAQHPAQRVSIIGEPIWAGRTDIEYPACAAHEALINSAFAGRDAAILCPYDKSALPAEVLDDAWRTHPVIADATSISASPHYDDPYATAASFNQPLPQPPDHASHVSYAGMGDLPALRAAVSAYAGDAGLTADRKADLVHAVNELAANTVDHSRSGQGRLTMWTEPGIVVCQIDDDGTLSDPMAGRIPAPPRSQRGRGLILVHHLVDLLRIYSQPDRTRIRLHMDTLS